MADDPKENVTPAPDHGVGELLCALRAALEERVLDEDEVLNALAEVAARVRKLEAQRQQDRAIALVMTTIVLFALAVSA